MSKSAEWREGRGGWGGLHWGGIGKIGLGEEDGDGDGDGHGDGDMEVGRGGMWNRRMWK
jgi:hypothetical protein